jgi:hypothetical protein
MNDDTVYGATVLQEAGITYRQLDHWCRAGFARPVNDGPGIGHARRFTRVELRRIVCMGRLVNAGMRPDAAYTIAQGDAAATASLLAAVELAAGGAT